MIGKTMKALELSGKRDQVKVVIGGSRIQPEYAESLKVDIYASDALEGAQMVGKIL